MNELHKALLPPRGLFASGKFDQNKRDIPYATLAQAFQRLVGMILVETEAELARYREAILAAVEPYGQLIINLIPELEVMLSADDYDAVLAERYGWINRAVPASQLGGFVSSIAQRIAGFPAAGHAVVKDRVNAIALAPVEDFRRDSDLFGEGVGDSKAQRRIRAALKRGFQTRDAEKNLGRLPGDLGDD